MNGKGPHPSPIPKQPQVFMNILDDCLSPTDSANGYITQKFQNYLLNFIKDRKIPENIKLFVAHKGKYKGRIIIPVYNNEGDLIYFQGRAVNESIKPKYLNPDIDKQLVIYNDGNFERDKYIVVSEGLLDAFMIPKQGTTCLGSSISEFFIKMLLQKTDKGVILAFDNDKPGIQSMLKFMKTNKYSNAVFYFLFPDKYSVDTDLNALVAEYKIDDVYQLVTDNSFSRVSAETKLRLRRKLL
jgi:DNA primase